MPRKDITLKKEDFPINPSTIETVDRAMTGYVNEELNIFCTTNKGWEKVPVIWVTAERAFQIKNNKAIHDSTGALILPLLTIERTSVAKSLQRKGIFNVGPSADDKKGGSITIGRRVMQEKTANFMNAGSLKQVGQLNYRKDTDRVVYETITIPVPIYLDIVYTVSIKTEYQQQINEILTPFLTKTDSLNYFLLKEEGHRYEGFIQENFMQQNNISSMGVDERIYETKFDINVLGYIIGADTNEERPKVIVRESAAEVKIPREYIIIE